MRAPIRSWFLPFILGATACGGDDPDSTLIVTWSFDAGDCAANGVEDVRVTWGRTDAAGSIVELACDDGQGTLGDMGAGGTFAIQGEGLDSAGAVVAESYGQTLTVGEGGTGGAPVDIHLHPAAADVTVTWTLSSGGTCPAGVILPYFITLYRDPAGGELTDEVANTQESCTTGEATLADVAPGAYVVEVDSRAVTPALRATASVEVAPGQDAEVAVQF